MSDYRNRPKGNYIFEAEWEALYILTEHWKSDLLFYTDDLKFLNHLIDKYFIWVTTKENIDAVHKTIVKLMENKNLCALLLKQVNVHLSHIAELMDDPFKYDSHQFRTEHEKLEDDIAVFVKYFRDTRKSIFAVTEHVIESEKFV